MAIAGLPKAVEEATATILRVMPRAALVPPWHHQIYILTASPLARGLTLLLVGAVRAACSRRGRKLALLKMRRAVLERTITTRVSLESCALKVH
jgi:hypothetical protein